MRKLLPLYLPFDWTQPVMPQIEARLAERVALLREPEPGPIYPQDKVDAYLDCVAAAVAAKDAR